MEWKQIFKQAKKTGAFTSADLETARSWPHCAVGDNLRSSGYNKSYTSKWLGRLIEKHDENLSDMGHDFAYAVSGSTMPEARAYYNSDDECRKKCIQYVNTAQKIYDKIQKTKPSQALIDELKLTVAPTAPS